MIKKKKHETKLTKKKESKFPFLLNLRRNREIPVGEQPIRKQHETVRASTRLPTVNAGLFNEQATCSCDSLM